MFRFREKFTSIIGAISQFVVSKNVHLKRVTSQQLILVLLVVTIQEFLSYIFVIHEHRVFFYDPRGFQEMAMNSSRAFHTGFQAGITQLSLSSHTEYPTYWTLPLSWISSGALNNRVTYIFLMTLLSLAFYSIAVSLLARIMTGGDFNLILVISSFLPLPFLLNLQGLPDLVSYSFFLLGVAIYFKNSGSKSTIIFVPILFLLSILCKKNFFPDMLVLLFSILIVEHIHFLRFLKKYVKDIIRILVICAISLLILDRGFISSLLTRNNSLFYSSYQYTWSVSLKAFMSYSGGIFLVGIALLGFFMEYARKKSLSHEIQIFLIFIVINSIYWLTFQKQIGIQHALHVFGIFVPLGLVLFITGRFSFFKFCSILFLIILILFSTIMPFGGFFKSIQPSFGKLGDFAPAISQPSSQTHLKELGDFVGQIQRFANTNESVLIPIGSSNFNEEMVRQYSRQINSREFSNLYTLPQVDLRDSSPFNFFLSGNKFVAVLSQDWIPDLPKGRGNFFAINQMLLSPQFQQFVIRSQKVNLGFQKEFTDARAVEMQIPIEWTLKHYNLVSSYLNNHDSKALSPNVDFIITSPLIEWGPNSVTSSKSFIFYIPTGEDVALALNGSNLSSVKITRNSDCKKVELGTNSVSQRSSLLFQKNSLLIHIPAKQWSTFLNFTNSGPGCNIRISKS